VRPTFHEASLPTNTNTIGILWAVLFDEISNVKLLPCSAKQSFCKLSLYISNALYSIVANTESISVHPHSMFSLFYCFICFVPSIVFVGGYKQFTYLCLIMFNGLLTYT
jgi:hypothetical protein